MMRQLEVWIERCGLAPRHGWNENSDAFKTGERAKLGSNTSNVDDARREKKTQRSSQRPAGLTTSVSELKALVGGRCYRQRGQLAYSERARK